MGELESVHELEVFPLGALELGDGLGHRFVVLAFVVEGVGQDKADIQRGEALDRRPRRDVCGGLKLIKKKVWGNLLC